MTPWLTSTTLARVLLALGAAAALIAAWEGYGRADIGRWFGAFLLCG